MEELQVTEDVNSQHSTTEKRLKTFKILAGIAGTALVSSNFINFVYFKKELDARVERDEVYPVLSEQLYSQGYSEVIKLSVDFEADEFTFISVQNESVLDVCKGTYEYHMHRSLTLGKIACVDIGAGDSSSASQTGVEIIPHAFQKVMKAVSSQHME